MTWQDLNDVDRARRAGQIRDNTLWGAAYDLRNDRKMSNRDLLGALVTGNKIDNARADECRRVIEEFSALMAGCLVNMKDYKRALFYAGLPETYAFQDIAAMLTRTGRLASVNSAEVTKRISETGGYTMGVIAGMTALDGDGMLAALRELGERHRKLAVTYQSGTEFPYINQVGLAYTLLTFSHTPFVAFGRAGRPVPDEETRQKWLAMWKIVGSLMGIEDDGMPTTPADADRLLALIIGSPGYGSSEAGNKLFTALKQAQRVQAEDKARSSQKAAAKLATASPEGTDGFIKYAGAELVKVLQP